MMNIRNVNRMSAMIEDLDDIIREMKEAPSHFVTLKARDFLVLAIHELTFEALESIRSN